MIEESFDDQTILSYVTVIHIDLAKLEGKDNSKVLHFDKVEVLDSNVDAVVELGQRHIGPGGWYFHLVKDSVMLVVFRGKRFTATLGDSKQLQRIRDYGVSLGIPSVQMPFEILFTNPYHE